MLTVLVDTNYLVALNVKQDTQHLAAYKFAASFRGNMIMPELVLVELYFVISELTNSYLTAANTVFKVSQSAIEIIPLLPSDYVRVYEIMTKYQSMEFDLVDAAIMTLSERLKISHVVTFDRRDFPAFRPKHVDYLTLLP